MRVSTRDHKVREEAPVKIEGALAEVFCVIKQIRQRTGNLY